MIITKLNTLIFAFLLLMAPDYSSAAIPPKPTPIQQHVKRDQESMTGACALDLSTLSGPPRKDQYWVVASFDPGKGSGDIIPGRVGNGRVLLAPHIEIFGTLNVSTALSPSQPPRQVPYKWQRPWILVNVDLNTDPDYLFILGGSGVCRLNLDASGPTMIDPDYPIPSEWTSFVKPAMLVVQSNPGIFDPANTTKNQTLLESLARSENPFLSGNAYRTLAEAGLLKPQEAKSIVSRTHGLMQAFLAEEILSGCPTATVDAVVESFASIIQGATSSRQIQGLSLAALVMANTRLLDELGAVQNRLGPKKWSGSYLQAVVQQAKMLPPAFFGGPFTDPD